MKLKLSIFCLALVSCSRCEIDLSNNPPLFKEDGDYVLWTIFDESPNEYKTSAYFAEANPQVIQARRGLDSNYSLFESENNGQIWALASDFYEKKIYFTDYSENYIGVFDIKTNTTKRLFQGMAFGIDSVSIDWVTGNVYWADSKFKWIMVADKSFTYYRNIISLNQAEIPALLSVHPDFMYIYWVENGLNNCIIKRSDLAGKNQLLLYTFTDVGAINSMVIDHINNRLYWTEKSFSKIDRVRAVDIDDSENYVYASPPTPETIFQGSTLSEFSAIASYKNYIYVTDFSLGEILTIDKETKEVKMRSKSLESHQPRDIAAYSKSEQPMSSSTNYCSYYHGCEHICIRSSVQHGYECQCRVGFKLLSDGMTCVVDIAIDDFALVMDSTHKKIYQMSMSNPDSIQEVQVPDIGEPYAVEYNPLNGAVYWSDDTSKEIRSMNLYGEHLTTVIKNVQTNSMAIDSTSGNLYWIDTSLNMIRMSTLTGSYERTVHMSDDYVFHTVTIDAKRGKLYWSMKGKYIDSSQIEVSSLDGSGRKLLQQNNYTKFDSSSIAVDYDNNYLFWPKGMDIAWMDLNTGTTGLYTLVSQVGHGLIVEHLTYYNEYLYIAEFDSMNLIRVLASEAVNGDGTAQSFGPNMFYAISSIEMFNKQDLTSDIQVCSENTCPQICAPDTSSETATAKCMCDDGFKYDPSTNTCSEGTTDVIPSAPTFAGTCPESILMYTGQCKEQALVDFKMPQAVDHRGKELPSVVVEGPSGIPQPPFVMPPGTHPFIYIATDEYNQTAVCIFNVQIYVRRCYSDVQDLSTGKPGVPSCGNIYGSTVDVVCPDNSESSHQYTCEASGQWKLTGTLCGQEHSSEETSTTGLPGSTKLAVTVSRMVKNATLNEDKASHDKIISQPSSKPTSITAIVLPILAVVIILAVIILLVLRKKKGWMKGTVSMGWRRQADDVEELYPNHIVVSEEERSP